MSRIGKKPVAIGNGVEVKIQGRHLEVKGPKGTLGLDIENREVAVEVVDKEIQVKKISNSKRASAIWGLTRSLLNNMITGVTEGYVKQLELQGVGYRMSVQGRKLQMALGFSHPVVLDIPEGLEAKMEEGNVLTISGIDKQRVGQFAAGVRALKKVEPYKGKGFRYVGERVRRKAGKKSATGK